jgi:adenylate cyclase
MWKKLSLIIQESRSILIIAPSVAGLVIVLRLMGLLQLLEWATLDQFFRWRPPEPADSRIVIVGISETDIQKAGQWPIPDAVMAQLIEKIKKQQPTVIGLDIYRDLPVEPGSQQLEKVFKTTPNLIGIQKVQGTADSWKVNPPPILAKQGQVGANNLVLDADGKVRRGLLFLQSIERETVPSFSLLLALTYLQAQGVEPKNADINPDYLQANQAVFTRFRANDGGYIRSYDQGYQILMNFRNPKQSFPMVSINEILQNRISTDLFRDKIVVIGSTAISLQDYFQTPYDQSLITAPSRTSGVEIHANLTSQIISATLDSRPLMKVWSDSIEFGWIFMGSVLGTILGWLGRYLPHQYIKYSLVFNGINFIITGTLLIGGSFLIFQSGWWIPVVSAVLALTGSTIAMTAYIANLEHSERQIIMNLFERHVTSKIAEVIWQDRHKILEQGQLQGQEMIATVLFTDLKGFSTISENMNPKFLMSWLNEYMSAMAQVVLDHDGIIDKFIGDAVMAVFGIPIPSNTPEKIALEAQKSVSCALTMAKALKTLNRQWKTQGKPTVSMRVGIATGTLVVGSLGSDKRQDYTIIGDTVNVASRLENYDKSIDGGVCRILIDQETYQYCEGQFTAKLIGSSLLKGRQQPVNIYQVLVE